jgi:Glycosyltransferase Family 4/Glycosyl transferases group 1
MKICIVAENHPSVAMGGAEYQTLLLTEELCRRVGHSVSYLARRVPIGQAAQGLPYGLRCIGDGSGIRRRAVFFDAFSLDRALRELQPDVIYQQMKQSYTGVCARYALGAGIPFFFHVAHDFDVDTAWFPYRLTANAPFDFIETIVGNWGMKHASHIIVQTERQGSMLREGFHKEPAATIRNFQPLPAALPAKLRTPFTVFWVANFKDVKRPELFVDLADLFSGRDDVEFVMAGRPTALKRFVPLMDRIARTRNLRYLGELPIDKVNEVMDRVHMHVNTSDFEGFPNTFIQAWGRGAVVASLAVDPDGGMEAQGIGYCTQSLERMHAVIDELVRTPERRDQVAQRAFEFAHASHSLAYAGKLADMMIDAAGVRTCTI